MADGSIKYIDFDGDRYEIDPCNHASESTKFGVGASGVYGHCKVIDDFTNGGGETNGRALSAHAGYVLNKMNYLVEGMFEYSLNSYLTIPYPIPEKAADTIVAGGIYKRRTDSNDSSWEDMKTTGFSFIYDDNEIKISCPHSFSYNYKIILITR
jgi:hypothetical protein